MAAVISSTDALWFCAPFANDWALSAITREPSLNWPVLSVTCPINCERSASILPMPEASSSTGSFPSTFTSLVRSPWAAAPTTSRRPSTLRRSSAACFRSFSAISAACCSVACFSRKNALMPSAR